MRTKTFQEGCGTCKGPYKVADDGNIIFVTKTIIVVDNYDIPMTS